MANPVAVFRVGSVIEFLGTFFDSSGQPLLNASDIKVTIRKPDGTVVGPMPLNLINGEAYMDFSPDIIGTWKIKLECAFPKRAVTESKFEVIPR